MARRSVAARSPGGTLADQADRYALYQASVNAPGDNIDFIDRVYEERCGHRPRVLREDFCGTALLAVEWARRGQQRRSIGVDLDPEALAWGARHNLAAAGPRVASRVQLVQADVLEDSEIRADVTCALNFSYFLLTARAQLVAYFRGVRRGLRPGGMLFLDCIGGTDAVADYREERDYGGFRYIWEQLEFNPLDHTARCSISFSFPDGSTLAPAFAYRWRVWTVPELRDCLEEAGFGAVRIFWEHPADTGTEYRETAREENQPIWLIYLVAAT